MSRAYYIFIFVLVIASGCASESKKLSEDALLSVRAFEYLNSVREAYVNRDAALLRELAPGLSEEISKEMTFIEAALTFQKRMVRITQDLVTVRANWQGTWTYESTGDIDLRGVADFAVNRESMKLENISGDNPFTAPGSIRYNMSR